MTTRSNSTILFKSLQNNAEYIYDDKSGAVLPVNELLKKAIDLYAKYDIDNVRSKLIKEYPEIFVDGTLKFIERWHRIYNGFFSTPQEKSYIYHNMISFKMEDIKANIFDQPSSFRQLVLNLTEDCNLRCKYCIYTDYYKYTRKPSKSKMKLETGKKAMDYFFKLNEQHARRNPGKRLAINFYGGEPFLCLSTMDKLIAHAKKNSPLPFDFFITTNGLLLKDEVADFIVNNKLLIAISLDGSKENHDRNRITINGRGSFDIAYSNIKRFLDRYPHYLRKHIHLICVYDMRTDLEANIRFFEENKSTLPNLTFIDAVLPGGDDDTYYDQFTNEEKEGFNEQSLKIMQRFVSDSLKGKDSPIFVKVFCGPSFWTFFRHRKAFDKRPDIVPFTNTCLPGAKISVRVDGTFDICERVNETMPIGNVETGLDWNAIADIIKKYNETLGKKCLSCSVVKLCRTCYGDGKSMQDGVFSIPEERCKDLRSDLSEYLSLTYSILEVNPDAFDWFRDFFDRPETKLVF